VRANNSGVWIVAERWGGRLRRISLELAGEGRRLADQQGGKLTAVIWGEGWGEHASTLGHYGADRVLCIGDSRFDRFDAAACARALERLLESDPPSVLLGGATSRGKDLFSRLAARLGVALASECISLSWKDGELTAVRPVFGGKVLATVTWEGQRPWLATLRPHAFPLPEPDLSRRAEVVEVDPDVEAEAWKSRILETVADPGAMVDLSEAEIVVAGGRGLKGPENFRLLEDLARVLGGAVAASRAAVDAGWRGHECQVGQTGKVISPKLYLACGISGSVQHLAGMSSSRCIVAVNKDPDAPIFKVADYGIVGDLFTVVPLLTEEFRRLLGSRGEDEDAPLSPQP